MDKDIVNSIDRALDVIIYLYHEGEPRGITEISKALGLYKSTVYRTLYTLVKRGFIIQNTETEKYWLGIRFFAIGSVVGEKFELREIIKPFAKELNDQFHETVNVAVLDPVTIDVYHSIIIYTEWVNHQVLSAQSPVGPGSECHCSSIGKCLLAYGKNIDLSVYTRENLNRYTKNTITDPDVFAKHLQQVHKQGYAVDDEELELGLTCVAAPILDKNSHALAAISLSGPTSRMRTLDFEAKIQGVCQTARAISNYLN